MVKLYSIGGHTLSYGGFMLREQGSGSLTVTKNVGGYGYDPTKTFEIVATFSRPVTHGGITATTHAVNLAHGQSAVFTDVPENTAYSVTETPLSPSDTAAGYSAVGVTGASGTMTDGGSPSAVANNFYEAPMATGTIRLMFGNPSYDPTAESYWNRNPTWTRQSSSPNIWDAAIAGSDWSLVFQGKLLPATTGDTVVLKAESSGVTNMSQLFSGCSALKDVYEIDTGSATNMLMMFYGCRSLTAAPDMDTGSATVMSQMFMYCEGLEYVPLLDTSSVTDVEFMFSGCTNVKGGALALYTQMSTQAVPPARHPNCFEDCGVNTATGAAELAQIPSSWK